MPRFIFTALLLFSAVSAGAQNGSATSIPQRDTPAIAILTQAVAAAGGSSAVGAVQDFTAQGTITHFWGDKPQQGQLTIKSRGLSQFRIESVVSGGTWSSAVNNGVGEIALPDGTKRPSTHHNTLNEGSLSWPIAKVNAALLDRTNSIVDMGLVSFGSGQARQIQIHQNLKSDPTGLSSKLTTIDYFFDPSSFFLLRVRDTIHPDGDVVNGGHKRIVDFGDYQAVSGVLVPFSIKQYIAGQPVWKIQLSSIVFNTGLSDPDFKF